MTTTVVTEERRGEERRGFGFQNPFI